MREINNEQIYELLLKVSKDVGEIKQTVNSIQEHVARIDERLTMTEQQAERISKLFNQKILDQLDKIAT